MMSCITRIVACWLFYAAARVVAHAARQRGAAEQEGVDAKARRYPAVGGKFVTACAADFDDLLAELAVLAAQRQRDRGQHPTRWLARWRTQISNQIAASMGKALLAAVPQHARPCSVARMRCS